jgi:adenylate cyclase class 2
MIIMSMEVEAKAHCKNIGEIEDRILGLGGEFQGEVEQIDTYYNHPVRDFAQTDEALRIRKVGENTYLTYKGRKIDNITKTREEIKVQVENGEFTRKILVKLGFSEVGMVRKVRKKYKLGEFHVCLDNVDNLGSFIELEAECDSDNPDEISRLRDIILTNLKEWGLEEIERKSYLELLYKL